MFSGQPVLYLASIRKLTAAVGSLFNNITITRFADIGGTGTSIRTVKVPLIYATGDKSYVFTKQHSPAQEKVQTKTSLPRIAYQLIDMEYDPSRKLPTTNRTIAPKTIDPVAYIGQMTPVPYNFIYEVYIASKTIDDGLQIIEQILPNFSPSFNLTVKEVPELGITRDVPIIFNQIEKEDIVEGMFDDERILIWTLQFTAKSYLYPNISDANVIRKVLISIYNNRDMSINSKEEVIQVSVDPIDAEETDDWQASTIIFDKNHIGADGEPLLDSNGDPIQFLLSEGNDIISSDDEESIII